jgi:hypothetical protein
MSIIELTKECEKSPMVERAMCLLDRVQNMIGEHLTALDSMLFFEGLPFPAWVKDIDGKMIVVNSAYKAVYPAINRNKDEVHLGFPEVILNQYAVNDLWVLKYRRPRVFVENAPRENEPDRTTNCLKFPVFSSDGSLAGVAGLEITTIKQENP